MEVEEEVRRIVEQVKDLHDSATSFVSSSSHEELSLRKRSSAVEASITRLHSTLLEEDLQRARCMLADGDSSSFLPSKPQGRFVRMFLGPVNVRASRKDIQLKVKEEYNSYRDRTALLFLVFPAILLTLRSYVWGGCLPAFPVQLYEAWLLFLYAGLAMRENILRANGSDIRSWFYVHFHVPSFGSGDITERIGVLMIFSSSDSWLYHHYCAMAMALVSLTWEIKGQPNCVQKQKGVRLFLQWAMMQGVAMLLQNRYQRQRLYTRIALGKAKRMDVVWGETAGVDGQLWLLCPLLFTLQGFEAYVGLQLLRTALTGVVAEWQVLICGILLVVMAVGNFINTVETLMVKSRFKAKMKRSKSRAELD
ncbi:hypothetical protein IGI04_036203 [Brassica rapa subsp. trilocularis]|uniref:TMPIT-like protein n=1 Tax=Brassica rapa subsp. trilocularis TaxID=1813537 RepID=A0ABQ7LGV7_BRACM|nr:hypothetical protein IGI04_036203 [Brassica rapa subsp. trilocularis]